jgi:hypothetical protein
MSTNTDPSAPRGKAGPDRRPTTPIRRTTQTSDPLADIQEIAEAKSPALAAATWARARPKNAELLRLARRVDLALDAKAITIILEANPSLDSEAGHNLKAQVLTLLAGIMTGYQERVPARISVKSNAKARPRRRRSKGSAALPGPRAQRDRLLGETPTETKRGLP